MRPRWGGAADYLVTDSEPPADLLDALRENEVELVTPETNGR